MAELERIHFADGEWWVDMTETEQESETIMTFDQQRAISDYTELQKLIAAGAYSERSAEDHLNNSWPSDGIEESIYNLTELAAKHNLEFIWHKESDSWSLVEMSDETREAREMAHDLDDQLNDGWSDKLAERGY